MHGSPLYYQFPTHITIDGEEYEMRPSWDRVLEAYDTRADQSLPYAARAKHICSLLLWDTPKDYARAAVELFRFFDGDQKQSDEPRSYDFKQDARYIYGAFWQTYGIRLTEWRDMRKKPNEKARWMHWNEFLYLFASLPEDTRMSAIIGIRTSKVPKRNEHNSEMVDHIIRQKAAFKLDVSEDDGAARFAKGASELFDKLEAQAKAARDHRKP